MALNATTEVTWAQSTVGRRDMAMTELEQLITGDGAAAEPAVILDGIDEGLAHKRAAGSPRSIYEELWHIAFWQKVSLDWVNGIATPYPKHASGGFPTKAQAEEEGWDKLRKRFFEGAMEAAKAAREESRHQQRVRCPSRPGMPDRTMTVREQLENLAAHNAYHFGRIVLLRQIAGAWPPKAGGYTW